MIAVSVSEMQKLEDKAIKSFDIPSILLMEDAAYGFVLSLMQEIPDISSKKITVICGKGNNGGDGFAIARLLYLKGLDVSVLPLFDGSMLSGDAKKNFDIGNKLNIPFLKKLDKCDIIVDAIFGTGFRGDVSADIAALIDDINNMGAYIASVDIPSGLSADSGQGTKYISADLCVTFGCAKIGQFLSPAKTAYKKLIISPISIISQGGTDLIFEKTFYDIPKREPDSHKGTYGKALAFVGSFGMAGAAILSGSAVLKSGAGMMSVATADTLIPSLAHHFPSVMTFALPTEDDKIKVCPELILEKSKEMDAFLIGCGIGTCENVKKTAFEIFKNIQIPTVIDADGLNILAQNIDILKEKKSDFILTPHVAEFSRLSGYSVSEIKKRPIELAKEFATRYGVCIILKDAVTVIADKNGNTALCPAENSGMATAGSGDVLAGIVLSMLSQSIAPYNSARLAVYIHSAAGKIAKDTLGEHGMTSYDILNSLPQAFLKSVDITPKIKEL